MRKGPAFLLKVSNGAPVPTFGTVAGLRATRLTIDTENAEAIAVSVEASGIFLGSHAERQVREITLRGEAADYELSFEGGEKMRGKFLVQKLDYAGDFNGERNYTIALQSAGPVVPA